MTGNRAPTAGGDTLPPPRNLAGVLRQYPEYKGSGVGWVGKVPDHWQVMPGRACYTEKKEPNTGLKEKTVLSLSYGKIVVKPVEKLHGLVPESFETYQIVDPGDIIIRPTDLQNDWNSLRFGLSHNRGIITSAYMCFRTKKNIDTRYGHLLLHTYDLNKVFYGLGSGLRQNLDWRDFKYLPCLVPPLPEQSSIVKFLEGVEKRIRHYILSKRKLIELLNEQKQAIVNQAVTRGIDPNVRLKPSGIEWLWDVPEKWKVLPFTKYVKEKADYRGATPEKVDNGIFLITAKNVKKGWIDYEISKEFIRPELYSQIMRRGLPKVGDLLLTTEAPLGNVALIDQEKIALAQRIVRFRMNEQFILPRYALYSLLSDYFQNQLLCRSTGSTAEGIKASKLPSLRILCPSLEEQKKIISIIESETKKLNDSIQMIQSEISLIHEYHFRLITDVVTGKIDVRNIEILDEMPVDDDVVEEMDELDDNDDNHADDNDDDENDK